MEPSGKAMCGSRIEAKGLNGIVGEEREPTVGHRQGF